MTSLAFRPDGKMLASASRDNAVKLWDVATWKEIATLEGHESIINSVAFSSNNRLLAVGGYNSVKLWVFPP